MAELCDRVAVSEHGEGAFGAERYPAVVVLREGEDTRIRFYGTPWGYELTSLVHAVLEAGREEPSLQLPDLARDMRIEVFVTPT